MNLVFSVAERFLLRGVSGTLVLIAALFIDPKTFGIYSVGIAILALVQMTTDTSLRQVGALLLEGPARARLAKRSLVLSLLAFPCLAAAFLGLTALQGHSGAAVWLLPLSLVPLLTASGTKAFVELQVAGLFAVIARSTAVGAMASLVVTLPLLALTGHPVSLVLQYLLSEGLTSALLRRAAGRHGLHGDVGGASNQPIEAWPVSLSNGLGWGQSQMERVIASLVASVSVLGSYAYASALARLLNDVIVGGFVAVARPRLAMAEPGRSRGLVLDRLVAQLGLLMSAGSAVIILVAVPVLGRLLSASWGPALDVVPVLLVAMGVAAPSWLIAAALIAEGSARKLLPLSFFGAALSVGVGLLAFWGLEAICFGVLAREMALTPLRLYTARGVVTKRTVAYWAGSLAVISAIGGLGPVLL